MKMNSRACNPRHLQDALGALSLAASAARVSSPLPSPKASPPSPLRIDRAVYTAARRAFLVGATPREIAGASLLPIEWARSPQVTAEAGRTWARKVA